MTSQWSISEFLAWIQFRLGAELDAAGNAIPDTSWSAQLQASERLWLVLEGTHVVTIMLFAGTILFVDLRLLGAAWRKVPVSQVADSVLPFTVTGFVIMAVTGTALFLAQPLEYYHSLIFRIKFVFLILAALNIFWFHYRVQRQRGVWDAQPTPPASARLAAAASITLWVLVIATGRYAAYGWVSCDRVTGLAADAAQCETYAGTMAHYEADMGL
jgi:hypothetical protein